FLARMVIPRSRSWSLESMMRSAPWSRRSRVPDWDRSLSTRVVLPWSTWAIIAILRSLAMLDWLVTVNVSSGGSDLRGAHYTHVGGPQECANAVKTAKLDIYLTRGR